MNDRSRPGSALRSPLLSCAFIAGFALSVDGLVHAVREQDALASLFGTWRLALLGGAAGSMILVAIALARRATSLVRGRGLIAAPPIRLVVYVFVAGALLEITLLQPFRTRHLHIALGLAGGALALADLCGGPLASRVSPRVLGAADVLAMNICLLALGGEGALRAAAALRPSPLLMLASSPLGKIEATRPHAGTVLMGFPVNSGGHFDVEFRPKRPRERLVVEIGDSFSTGVVPRPFHFTRIAERSLGGATLYNMGVPAIGPPEYLWLLGHEALPLRPDVVAIDIFVGNDVSESRERSLQRLLFDRDNVLLYQVPRRLARLARERADLAREAGPDAAPGGAEPSADLAPRAPLPPSGATVADLERAFPWVADPEKEQPSFSRERFLDIERDRAVSVCTDRIEDDLRAFLRCLAEIEAAARGTPLVFVIIPDEFQVEEALWHDVAEMAGRPLERDRPQREIRTWLERERLRYLDLLPVLRAVPPLPDGRRHLYHLRNTHWNARGNAVAGEAIGKFLAPFVTRGPSERP